MACFVCSKSNMACLGTYEPLSIAVLAVLETLAAIPQFCLFCAARLDSLTSQLHRLLLS